MLIGKNPPLYKYFNKKKMFRQFIITFFLNDDTLSVYEPTVRNSGFYMKNKIH